MQSNTVLANHTALHRDNSFTSKTVSNIEDARALRAYEHARQSALHPADKTKAKRNIYCNCCKVWKWRGKSGRARPDEWKDLRALYASRVEELAFSDDHVKEVDCLTPLEVSRVEVLLADLLRPAKKAKGFTRDFEFIQSVPRVITLEDEDGLSDEAEMLSDWECVANKVEANPAETLERPPLSYAEVVLHAKKM